MNSKLILPALFTTAFTSLAAQADLSPDSAAHNACLSRFENINRAEGLLLRPSDTYQSPVSEARSYHYFFNASGPRAEAEQRHYRVECQARRNGKVIEFAINPGQWVYEAPVDTRIASR